MKVLTRTIAFLIAATALLSLAGCGDDKSAPAGNTAAVTVTTPSDSKPTLIVAVDTSLSANSPQLRSDYYTIARDSIAGPNMEWDMDGFWGELDVWKFPLNDVHVDKPYSGEVAKGAVLRSTEPEITSLLRDHVEQFKPAVDSKGVALETNYIPLLKDVTDYCDAHPNVTTWVAILTDGGDQGIYDKDPAALEAAVKAAARCKNLGGVAFGPVNSQLRGNMDKALRLFADEFGDRMVVITDGTVTSKLTEWQTKIKK